MPTNDVFLKSEVRRDRWVPRVFICSAILFCVFVVGHVSLVADAVAFVVGAITFVLAGNFRQIGLTPAGNLLVVTRTWDLVTLRRREIATNDIEGVSIRCQYMGSDGHDSIVGLLLRSGKFVQLAAFTTNNHGAEHAVLAQRFAQEVLEFTHLPFCGKSGDVS